MSNIGILLLNKHLLGGYGFKFPVFLTLCHMLACVILSQVQTPAWSLIKPLSASGHGHMASTPGYIA